MSNSKSQSVWVDDKEYSVDDLNKEQKYLILQTQDLNRKADNLKFQLDQILIAQEVFSNKLRESLMDKVRDDINKKPKRSVSLD